VTATKESSGCISNPVTSEILDNRIYPTLQVVVKNANCKESNGSAKVNVLNNASIEEVVWSDGFRLFYGASLENQPYGTFEVTVITTEKCSTSQEVVIEPDILVYNGISANGDGINDKFKIACIDRFFNNQVKIFNRSGRLVYEIQYYDNEVNYFEGYGNSGLYLGKKELPVGTYFYLIDLRNETPPRTGYLELTR
jgi:gliding motility-associated-like protein